MDYFSNPQILIEYLKFFGLLFFAISLALAQIPAKIAAKKGYSFVGFLFFGLFFFLVALVVSLFLTDKLAPTPVVNVVCQHCQNGNNSLCNKLSDLKKAYDSGLINDNEYIEKRTNYLKEY